MSYVTQQHKVTMSSSCFQQSLDRVTCEQVVYNDAAPNLTTGKTQHDVTLRIRNKTVLESFARLYKFQLETFFHSIFGADVHLCAYSMMHKRTLQVLRRHEKKKKLKKEHHAILS